jgi:transcription antitermination protein NusB
VSDPFAPELAAQRREARERAIELVYEAEMKQVEVGAIISEATLAPEPLAVELALGISEQGEQLDAELAGLLHEGWSLGRLGTLDRLVLRLGLYELRHRPQVPRAVVIDEAVELAKKYGATDESGGFVNGVLGTAARGG